jgi:hypothetical protein
MRHRVSILSFFLAAVGACYGGSPKLFVSAEDSAIAEVVLEDFAKWKEATFGAQRGVLAVAPTSLARPGLTPDQVADLAPNIRGQVTQELASALVERNKVSAPIAALLASTHWAKVHSVAAPDYPRELAPGIKASGHIALPGISTDFTSALIQISHTWSMHSAVVTYVLTKERGVWRIVARDQVVFL